MTEKLFYKDAYQTEWITEAEKSEKTGNNYEVILKETYFYPEGGGQPGDRGSINGCEVVNTVKNDNGEIIHICSSDPGSGRAECSLDWARRWDYMQQHAGQHIISAVLKNELDINTVSVHQGEEYTSVETDRGEISSAEIDQLNAVCNKLILDNIPVRTFFIDSSELPGYPLRRPTDRKGKIRIVELENYDRVACGGVHTAKTGEVRMIHIFSTETLRNHSRVLAKIGDRVLSDYALKSRICSYFTDVLSAPPEELAEKWRISQEVFQKQKARAAELERKLADVLFRMITPEEKNGISLCMHCFTGQDTAAVKETVKKLMDMNRTVFCIGNTDGGKLLWQVGSSPDINFPFDSIKEEIFRAVSGKGGGKAPLWQGYGDRPDGFSEMADIIINYKL